MKVIVLHGDNVEKVSDRITEFVDAAKKRGWSIERLDKEGKLSLSETMTAGELFEKEKLYLVNNPSSFSKKELAWLKKNHNKLKGNIVFYEERLLTKTALSFLPKPDKVEEHKLPRIIFKFLESFYPGNSQVALELLHTINEPPEFVLAMLARHLKDVYVSKEAGSLDYPSWREEKLKSQASKFSRKELKDVIGELAQADFEAKTSSQDLLTSLDLIIATRLE